MRQVKRGQRGIISICFPIFFCKDKSLVLLSAHLPCPLARSFQLLYIKEKCTKKCVNGRGESYNIGSYMVQMQSSRSSKSLEHQCNYDSCNSRSQSLIIRVFIPINQDGHLQFKVRLTASQENMEKDQLVGTCKTKDRFQILLCRLH